MIDLENVLSRADSLTKIASIAKRGKALRDDVNLVAVSTLIHAAEHGDLTLATKLHDSVPVSFRADLKRYYAAFGPIRWVKGKGFNKLSKGGAYDIDGALSTSFDAVDKPEKSEAEYDRNKELTAIVKFLDTKADRAINADDADMLAMLVGLAGVVSKLVS